MFRQLRDYFRGGEDSDNGDEPAHDQTASQASQEDADSPSDTEEEGEEPYHARVKKIQEVLKKSLDTMTAENIVFVDQMLSVLVQGLDNPNTRIVCALLNNMKPGELRLEDYLVTHDGLVRTLSERAVKNGDVLSKYQSPVPEEAAEKLPQPQAPTTPENKPIAAAAPAAPATPATPAVATAAPATPATPAQQPDATPLKRPAASLAEAQPPTKAARTPTALEEQAMICTFLQTTTVGEAKAQMQQQKRQKKQKKQKKHTPKGEKK